MPERFLQKLLDSLPTFSLVVAEIQGLWSVWVFSGSTPIAKSGSLRDKRTAYRVAYTVSRVTGYPISVPVEDN